jgi:endoglucanase
MARWAICSVALVLAAIITGLAFIRLHGTGIAAGEVLRPRLLVNQLGYLPDGPKRGTLITEAEEPLSWRLLDASGRVVAAGQTSPAGVDPTAGRNVHVIDFSAFVDSGEGYRLAADGERSFPFAIGRGFYSALARDAFGYFHFVRSGIAIDGAVAGEAYARPAGHFASPGDGVVNKGDRDVPCLEASASQEYYGEPWTCDYTLDVTGGWYDAGDFGKYVVNGGISVAQLMSAYERALHVEGASPALLGDGVLAIPEAGNGIPDILDEARWELEFLLGMQVPEGRPLAGMAHHKVHGVEWARLGILPHEDDKRRVLYRPSTAATLNLAAAAAQGARLLRPFDPAFADRLQQAAERAYEAAKDNPALHAPAEANVGGGPYSDSNVSDEFYWAAAELFITTAKEIYRADLLASHHFHRDVFEPAGFSWGDVAALGRLSLSLVPNGFDAEEIAGFRRSVVAAADRYLALQEPRAFGQLHAPDDGRYGWGSNHSLAQIGIIVSRAHDYTRDQRFRMAALEGADYLLGRNALANSYVTGHGSLYSRNQHASWFAHQKDPRLPRPPNGALAGGPNAFKQDELAAEKLAGCAPQYCYLDDVDSWSTNEIAINWNAALAQFAAFLAEQ